MAKKIQVIQPITGEWKTLHIFGYGKTQLNIEVPLENSENFNGRRTTKIVEKKVDTSTLTNAQALVDFVYGLKPADSNAGVEYHAVTIVKDIHCLYVPKTPLQEHFRIKYADMDATLIQNLVSELEAITI
jgi:hypothetical protein